MVICTHMQPANKVAKYLRQAPGCGGKLRQASPLSGRDPLSLRDDGWTWPGADGRQVGHINTPAHLGEAALIPPANQHGGQWEREELGSRGEPQVWRCFLSQQLAKGVPVETAVTPDGFSEHPCTSISSSPCLESPRKGWETPLVTGRFLSFSDRKYPEMSPRQGTGDTLFPEHTMHHFLLFHTRRGVTRHENAAATVRAEPGLGGRRAPRGQGGLGGGQRLI